MMEGPASAKKFVSTYLEGDLTGRCAKYRNHWNISEEFLSPPLTYLTWAAPSLEYMTEELPACYTVIISTSGLNRGDYTNELDPIYTVNYEARTYVWVRHDSAEQATISRDNLMTVVRTALLDHQCLSAADTDNLGVKFDEGTMREEFSDLIPGKGGRYAAGGYISYTMTINETVTRDFIGDVSDVEVTHYAFLEP